MGEARDESYEVLNARGGLAIPPFIEPHIHLDTTQTAGEPHWNQSGTLFEGIERWAERKALLSHEGRQSPGVETLSGRSPMACSLSALMSTSPIPH